jgi:sec-independent protein translocase protein TatC
MAGDLRNDLKPATYKEHFLELKRRLIYIIFFFLAAFLISYLLKEFVAYILIKPLVAIKIAPVKIIYTALPEAFLSYLQLSLFSALLITMPFISYQAYAFVAPGLYDLEKTIAKILFSLAPALFMIACLFVYFLIMPIAWKFFSGFSSIYDVPIALEAKINQYFDLTIKLMFSFGVAFELPIILIMLFLLKIVSLQGMIKKRRIAIVINFILAAFLTPPDVLTQVVLALPMCLLYEATILVCKNINQLQGQIQREI